MSNLWMLKPKMSKLWMPKPKMSKCQPLKTLKCHVEKCQNVTMKIKMLQWQKSFQKCQIKESKCHHEKCQTEKYLIMP